MPLKKQKHSVERKKRGKKGKQKRCTLREKRSYSAPCMCLYVCKVRERKMSFLKRKMLKTMQSIALSSFCKTVDPHLLSLFSPEEKNSHVHNDFI